MNPTILPSAGSKLGSLNLVWQPVWKNENSKFKSVKLSLKVDLVLHPVCAERLENTYMATTICRSLFVFLKRRQRCIVTLTFTVFRNNKNFIHFPLSLKKFEPFWRSNYQNYMQYSIDSIFLLSRYFKQLCAIHRHTNGFSIH